MAQTHSGSEPSRARPFVLRYPWLTAFSGASGVSQLGDAIMTLGLPWLVYDMTQSATAMALVFFVQGLPPLLLPAVGVLVDRLPKRRLLIASDVLQAALVGLIPLLYMTRTLRMWHILLIAPCLSLLSNTFSLTLNSVTPLIVDRADLAPANSLLQTVSTTARLMGPTVAGALIAAMGVPAALLVDSVSFGAIVVVAFWLRADAPAAERVRGLREGFTLATGGFRYLARRPVLRDLAGLSFTSNVANAAFEALLVFTLRSRLGLDATQSGLVFSAMGAAALAGALLSGLLGSRCRKGVLLLTSQAVCGTGMLMMALTRGLAGVVAAVMLYKGPQVLYNVTSRTLRQQIIPLELLGRVTSAYLLLALVSGPVSGLAAGPLAESFGVPRLILGAAVVQFGAVAGAAFSSLRGVR